MFFSFPLIVALPCFMQQLSCFHFLCILFFACSPNVNQAIIFVAIFLIKLSTNNNNNKKEINCPLLVYPCIYKIHDLSSTLNQPHAYHNVVILLA